MRSGNLTMAGAEALGARIRDYWAEQGLDVQTWTEGVESRLGSLHAVRSDMANGWPVRRATTNDRGQNADDS